VKGARYIPSPNCDERPAACAVDLLVLHHISLPPGEFGGPAIVDLFTNRLDPAAHPYYAAIAHAKVSAHFLIRRVGERSQFVPCEKRAWHAGESSWQSRSRCNDFSIGVELEGTGEAPYTDAQYDRLAALTRALKSRYPIAHIVGHSDVAPGRKNDPGPSFDWGRYRGTLKKKRRRSAQAAVQAGTRRPVQRRGTRRARRATPRQRAKTKTR
jgi:AmpD protein